MLFRSWYSFTKNPNITWEIVKNNPIYDWNYGALSLNPNITWDIINDNPDIPWDFWNVSLNPNISWEIVKNNPDKNWNFKCLSNNFMTPIFNNYIKKKEICMKIFSYLLNDDIAQIICSYI